MKKYIRIIGVSLLVMLAAAGCGTGAGRDGESEIPVVEDFDAILNDQRTQVIVRDEAETAAEETQESAVETEPETVVAYADRIADGSAVACQVETAVYEEGVVRVEYPQLTGMADAGLQQEINDRIRSAVTGGIATENLSSYEMRYETATLGSGMVSFIFRGIESCKNSAYPDNVVKTLNIDLNTGRNLRLKEFSDMALVVSSLELTDGYSICNEGVDQADFSAYLNNGAVTDYAITLLDYDFDFQNPDLVPAGYSAIRDNHLILFMKAEHAMGDYVELEFHQNL